MQLLHAGNLKLTEAQYLEVITRKTAVLMSAACQVGAIVRKVTAPQEEVLRQFGLNLGISFQVADDILDIVGEERQLGKPTANDLKEGRITLPLIHALTQAEPQDRERIREMAWNLAPEMAPEFRNLLGKYLSVDYARGIARNYTPKAQENLATFPTSPEKTYFWAISEELLHRTH